MGKDPSEYAKWHYAHYGHKHGVRYNVDISKNVIELLENQLESSTSELSIDQPLIQDVKFRVNNSNPMAPHDFFDLDGKMGGSGMGGGLGRGIVKNVPPVLQKQPDFKWNVKQSNVADKIGRHPVFGKIYKDPSQKIGNKEVWWSKDTAKHGGTEYKLFEEKSDHFKWIGDVDLNGHVVLKHKSEIGRYIAKQEINWIK